MNALLSLPTIIIRLPDTNISVRCNGRKPAPANAPRGFTGLLGSDLREASTSYGSRTIRPLAAISDTAYCLRQRISDTVREYHRGRSLSRGEPVFLLPCRVFTAFPAFSARSGGIGNVSGKPECRQTSGGSASLRQGSGPRRRPGQGSTPVSVIICRRRHLFHGVLDISLSAA